MGRPPRRIMSALRSSSNSPSARMPPPSTLLTPTTAVAGGGAISRRDSHGRSAERKRTWTRPRGSGRLRMGLGGTYLIDKTSK